MVHAYVYVHPSKGNNYIWNTFGDVRIFHGQIILVDGESSGIATSFWGSTYDTDNGKYVTERVQIDCSSAVAYPAHNGSTGNNVYTADGTYVGMVYGLDQSNYKQYGDTWRVAAASGSCYSLRTATTLYSYSGGTYTPVKNLTTADKVIFGAGQGWPNIASAANIALLPDGAMLRCWGYIQASTSQTVETSGLYVNCPLVTHNGTSPTGAQSYRINTL